MTSCKNKSPASHANSEAHTGPNLAVGVLPTADPSTPYDRYLAFSQAVHV